MEVTEQKYITIHLTKEEINTLRNAKKITEHFLHLLEDEGFSYEDYINLLMDDDPNFDEKNINDVLLTSDNTPIFDENFT